MAVRVDALAWHLERQFGAKIPQCRNCGSHDLYRYYERASYRCNDCGMEISDHLILWVPKDESVRNPDEEHKPEGMWRKRFEARARAL